MDTLDTQSVQILSLPIFATLPIFTVCAIIYLTLTPDFPILLTAIPQLSNSATHSIEYIALLKPLNIHFWLDALPCRYDPHWLINTFLSVGLWTYLNAWRFTATQIVLVMVGILNMCVSLSLWLFLWILICGLVQVLFLIFVVNF